MQNLLSILEELKEQTEKTRRRSWKWLRVWSHFPVYKASSAPMDPEREPFMAQSEQPNTPKDASELVIGRRNPKQLKASLREMKEGYSNRLFRALRVLEREDG